MDNIQEAINWFDAEIKAQESGYAFALASGKERDEHFENWLDIMRAALVALRRVASIAEDAIQAIDEIDELEGSEWER